MAVDWTPERRAKQAALINRIKPWLTTKGPVTPEGKARSSKNGFKGNPRATVVEAGVLARLLLEDARVLAQANHGRVEE